jgi:catechol 2,3-dioxygenase-like lactoylglutathione lyase family enzyme
MLRDSKAFGGFSVKDIDAARSFYRDTLGLDVGDDPMGFLELHLATGGSVLIYQKDDHVPAEYTCLNFPVADIDEAVTWLNERGVTTKIYDGEWTDERGIARGSSGGGGPDICWFKDPDGNVLSVLVTGEE